MRLLLDQNISFRLCEKLKDIFQGIQQVRELGIENYSDSKIWEYAKKHNYTIVPFDSDFYDFTILKNYPPKVIWLKTGNTNTLNIEILLRKHQKSIEDFVQKQNFGCLEIY